MYKSLMAWVKATHPELKTVYGGVEKDFAHSNATYGVMKAQAEANGFQVLGTSEWLLNDTTFSTQVRDMRRANADIVAISAHPFTTCGVLKEMERQGVKPKLLIGLTSSSSIETLQGCAKQAEGLIIPTSFAPVNPEATKAAENVAKFGGSADLHSAAAYEIMFILKDVIEKQKIMAKPDTVAGRSRQDARRPRGAEGDHGSSRQGWAHAGPRGDQAVPVCACQGRHLAGPAQAVVLSVCGLSRSAADRYGPPPCFPLSIPTGSGSTPWIILI